MGNFKIEISIDDIMADENIEKAIKKLKKVIYGLQK